MHKLVIKKKKLKNGQSVSRSATQPVSTHTKNDLFQREPILTRDPTRPSFHQ